MIVLIANWYYGDAAVERRARHEVAALEDAGKSVLVITAVRGHEGERGGAPPPGRRIEKLRPRHPWVHRHTILQELFFVWRCRSALLRVAEREPVDLVVCHSSSALVAALPLLRHRPAPTAFVVHALVRERRKRRANSYRVPSTLFYSLTEAIALRRANAVIGVSKYMSSFVPRRRTRVRTLSNPVDVDLFRPVPPPATVKDIDVLFVGRLSREKGVHVLVEAARQLPASTRIVIVGSGSQLPALRAAALSAEARIEFWGYVANDQLPALLPRARLQVVPSLSEPQGVVVLEAFACGVPVIASAVGGIPEMVEDGVTGWLVPPSDPSLLAERIDGSLGLGDALAPVGHAARARADAYSLARFKEQVVTQYEELISGSA